MSLTERFLPEDDRRLLRYARRVDHIDRISSPIAATMQLYGSGYLPLIGVAMEVAELALLKVPFVVQYLRRTKDYDALASWLPKEIFAGMVPYGDLVDLMRSYEKRTEKYFQQQIEKKLDE